MHQAFDELWNRARFSEHFWPVLADESEWGRKRSGLRDLDLSTPAGESEWGRLRSGLRELDGLAGEPEWGRKRDLGELPVTPTYRFRINNRIRLVIRSDRPGHLTLLDEGTSGKIYCLCPSRLAPDTRLYPGLAYLPQIESPRDAFYITGKPGQERLVAIITDEPLGLDWVPSTPESVARTLNLGDIKDLLERLWSLRENSWQVLAIGLEIH